MYEQPVLFPAISNRETWYQIIQINDDETGDLISLTDSSGNNLYNVYLEIVAPRRHGYSGGGYPESGWYGDYCEPVIFASLADYITIPDTGTIQIQIPYTVMQKMHGGKTYDVFLRLEAIVTTVTTTTDTGGFSPGFDIGFNVGNQVTTTVSSFPDARQLFIGKLPIYHGGRGP